MKHAYHRPARVLSCLFTAFALLIAASGMLVAGDSDSAKKLFAKPTREYSSAPLWVWNDMLTEQQVRDTMRDLAGQDVKQVFVHPRPGLMTPYLSPDWFRLWKVALNEAEKLDMNVWIYDENSYPSGFAGGWVPELMPESRGRGLFFQETKTAPAPAKNLVAAYRIDGDRYEDVTAKVANREPLSEGRYLAASVRRAENSPWHGDRCYVDLLYPGVTEKFIELTHEAYRKEVGQQFGKRIPGIFTDEPELHPAGGMAWTDDLPMQFQKRWGYRLEDHLPSLQMPIGDWRKVRHHYHQTVLDLFVERWAKPYYDYCATNNLEFTGHYWDHEWPNCGPVPDNMAMSAWQQRPGIDILMNQYAENTHAQFGNVRVCREISSLANQLGRARTLVELYGAGGWDLRFEDMKRIGDWLEVLGVNTLDQHLSYVTIRGARKRDHPQSFSYHEPWWKDYHVSASYLNRVTVAVTQGKQINRVLVIEPTTTAWMYQGHPQLNAIADQFMKLLMSLESAQIEYDLGCEDVIARHGSNQGKELQIGQRSYPVVVIPPLTENLNEQTVKLLEQFLQAGGQVIDCGEAPVRVNGALSERGTALAKSSQWKQIEPAAAPELLRSMSTEAFKITRSAGDRGILFHHRRQMEDGQLVFLVNTSIDAPSVGELEADAGGVEQWDLNSGKPAAYPFLSAGKGIQTTFELPPSGSLLLFLTRKTLPSVPVIKEAVTQVAATGPVGIHRVGPNVLTLDYVDITARGETRQNQYYYAAGQFAFQKNGMPRNPWDSAVQFRNELITNTFPADSGFAASYKFRIEEKIPGPLYIVIERPDLYTITCNGAPVRPVKGAWWLDKAFGKIDITKAASVGENIVTITAQPFSIFHEIESAYLLGDFTLKPANKGFVVRPAVPLKMAAAEATPQHAINPDETMWLSGGIGFKDAMQTTATDDRAPYVIFDLGHPTTLGGIQIWNYNENHVRDLTGRGTAKLRITASLENNPASYNIDLGAFALPRGNGKPSTPEALSVAAKSVRYVRFDILANHNGVTYPVNGESVDNALVGLAEVRFLSDTKEGLKGVRVIKASSELASHRRKAASLVNGSGLMQARGLGWNDQGLPFYSEGVAYRQTFPISKREGKYVVALPSWLGSVANVVVNGKSAGHISAPPWECEVTPLVKKGPNEIEVVVIGTLKNTLGPHHGRPGLGTAWPSMFHNGPKDGPPPGADYSTVSYGLFEPVELKQRRPE